MEKISHKIVGYSAVSRLIAYIHKVFYTIFEPLHLIIGFVHKNKFTPTREIEADQGKRIIMMCGCPGTGKTMIAKRLHQMMNGTSAIIHRDSIRDLHLGKGFFHPVNKVEEVELERIDQEFLDQAKKQLHEYDIIILDAGFRNYSKRKEVYKIAEKYRCEVVVILCTCRRETSSQRLQKQIDEGEKRFDFPVTWTLKYCFRDFEEPTNKTEPAAATIIQIDTEQNHVTALVPEEKLSDFAKQLIRILESASLCPETSKINSLY
jgi:predicted kinase